MQIGKEKKWQNYSEYLSLMITSYYNGQLKRGGKNIKQKNKKNKKC